MKSLATQIEELLPEYDRMNALLREKFKTYDGIHTSRYLIWKKVVPEKIRYQYFYSYSAWSERHWNLFLNYYPFRLPFKNLKVHAMFDIWLKCYYNYSYYSPDLEWLLNFYELGLPPRYLVIYKGKLYDEASVKAGNIKTGANTIAPLPALSTVYIEVATDICNGSSRNGVFYYATIRINKTLYWVTEKGELSAYNTWNTCECRDQMLLLALKASAQIDEIRKQESLKNV